MDAHLDDQGEGDRDLPYYEAGEDDAILVDNRDGDEDQDRSGTDQAGSPIDANVHNISFQEKKWKRVRKHYNDHYLELFKETFETVDDDISATDLASSQLGAVTWETTEKSKLYQALSRKGRHDLPSISDSIGTKSPLEVKVYLDWLRQELADRQLFEAQTKNISHADIPAAIEIRPECESALEKAADALAAFQEQYDYALGQNGSGRLWLVDHEQALKLDEDANRHEDTSESTEGDNGANDHHHTNSNMDLVTVARIFRLSKWLELSERCFMNRVPEEFHDNWHDLSEQGQSPAMTTEVVVEMYDIMLNLIRRLVQSILFIAQSRLRSSSTTHHYRPAACVKKEDVVAALDVLNLKRDSWDYWVHMPRRNGLRVVTSSHRKGVSEKVALSYDAVERTLSTRNARGGGRRRSLSLTTESSLDEGAFPGEPRPDDDNNDGEDANSISAPSPGHRSHTSSRHEPTSSGCEGDDESSSSDSDIENEASPTVTAESSIRSRPMSKQKRRNLLEAQEDLYMERIDRLATQQEEARLLQLIGHEPSNSIKGEDAGNLGGRRPKVLRKSIDDVMGWSATYQAEWELCDMPSPGDFEAHRAKRLKTDGGMS